MVLAVEEAVEDVAEGADVVEVVKDDHGGELFVRLLRVALLCQAGQVLTQVLEERASEHEVHENSEFSLLLWHL